jgi:VWFA-related protein
MSSVLRGGVVSLLFVGCWADAVAQDQPIFRTGTTQVVIEAVVTDDGGSVVRGLTAEDFVVEEEGERRAVSTFSFVEIPLGDISPAGDAVAVAPDVSSNETPFDGRVYLLVLDDIQTELANGARVRSAARRFIEDYFRDNDLMAVVHTSGRLDNWQELTADRPRLLAAVAAFQGLREPARPPPMPLDSDGVLPEEPAGGPRTSVVGAGTVGVLRDLAEWAGATMPGRRKSILFVSDGFPGVGTRIDVGRCDDLGRSQSPEALCEAIAAAASANAAIFTVAKPLPRRRAA